MAKIQNAVVSTIKIADGAITEWFYPSGGSIDVHNESGNPTFFWLTCESGTRSFVRSRDSKVVATVSGYERVVCFDEDPEDDETYTWTGSGSSAVVAAKVRKK